MHFDLHNKQRSLTLPRMALIPVLVGAALLTACGKSDKDPAKASQAAASVNGQEVTVHQINLVLERQPGLKPEQVDAASRQVLEGLIDQEIAVQKAEEDKMDRDPKIVQLLDAQRRNILARAYLEKASTAAIGTPGADEIKKYFDTKPALFSNRRIYMLQEFTIQGTSDETKALQAKLESAPDVPAFAQALKDSGLKFGVNQVTQPAEALPLNVVDRLGALKDGQALYEQGNGGMKAILVVASRPQPLTFDQAKPLIERFLTETKRQEWLQKRVKELRTEAKVEYIGKFAEKAASAPEGSASAAAASTPTSVATPAPASAASSGIDPAALSKGLSGLK